MNHERLAWLRLIHLAVDGAGLVCSFVLVVWLRARLGAAWPLDLVPGVQVLRPVGVGAYASLSWLVVPVWLAVLGARGRYRRLTTGAQEPAIAPLLTSAAVAAVVLLGVVALLGVDRVSRTVVVAFAVASAPSLWASRRVAHRVSRSLGDVTRVRVVGADADVRRVRGTVAAHPEWGVVVVDSVAAPSPEVADDVDEVLCVGTLAPETLSRLALTCEEVGVALSIDASFLGARTAHAEVRQLGDSALVTFTTTPVRGMELAVKRGLDLIVGALGLLLMAPGLLVVMAVIRRDGGPALFRQERVGRYGRRFQLWKLRTMRVGAEGELASLEAGNELRGPAFKLTRDPRVTGVGRWLRRWSLDELPQLVNVVRGDMSLVGPRPALPTEVAQYARWQRRRLSMRPGITGLWQVTARDDTLVDRWIALDLAYIDGWSLGADLSLMARTVPAVVVGKGAR